MLHWGHNPLPGQSLPCRAHTGTLCLSRAVGFRADAFAGSAFPPEGCTGGSGLVSVPRDGCVSPPAASRGFSCLSPGRSRGRCSLVLPFAMRVLSPSEISSLGSGLAGADDTTVGGGGGAGGAGILVRPVSSFLGGGTGSGDLASRPGSLALPASSPGRTLRTTLRTTRTTLRRESPWPSSPCASAAGPSSPFTAAPFSTGSGLFPLPGGGSGLFAGSGVFAGSGFGGSAFGGSAFGIAGAASFGLSDCSHNDIGVSGGPASTALWDVVVSRALPCHGAQLLARLQHWGHSTLPHQPTAPQWILGQGAVVTSLPYSDHSTLRLPAWAKNSGLRASQSP